MFKKLAICFVTSAGLVGFVGGEEVDNRTPLEKYKGDTYFARIMCSLKLRTALLKQGAGETDVESIDYEKCITKGKTDAKKSLDITLTTIKKSRAKEALKSYHVAFIAALEGIRPGLNERKINYEQRQQALEDKMTEAWARFEVEQ